ncbi:MAG: glycogen debranching enzyme N-terminal domain-containing protein [Rikenellaceae bacterium]
MAALTFDKKELGNLEYSLQREMLATDRRGGYMSTTIVCCNTRKYHGLIVAPIDESDRDFVLLSSLDETLVLDGQRFNLALHRFKDTYEPRGHKYITDFEYTPAPTITYRVADIVLRKELLWIHKRTQLMVRYTLVESPSESVSLQLRPFLAFRDRHELSHANMYADPHSYPVHNGVKCRLYDGFPWLHMQLNRDGGEFVPAPDWYYDFEYTQELARGYEGHEDLLTPGFFELSMKQGESVIFSASVDEMFSNGEITEAYDASVDRRTHKVDTLSCLRHSARQFVIRHSSNDVEVVAGYPWYGVVGREALISLPGLTLEQGNVEVCMEVLDTIVRSRENGVLRDSYQIYNAVDAQLWFIRALQRLEEHISRKEIWAKYSKYLISLLGEYKAGAGDKVSLHDNGLIWAWSDDYSISSMNITTEQGHSKHRNGYIVEVNALWYNAVCYTLSLAEEFGDKAFVAEWQSMPELIKESFISTFWMKEGWMKDYVNFDEANQEIRPNMIIACALPYKMVSVEQVVNIIRTIDQHLLTPKGLRSLSPNSINYDHTITMQNSTSISKNGSVWVWTLAMYVRACFDVMGENFLPKANSIIEDAASEIQHYGIASVGEYFDSAPPYASRGAISQAWSVSAILDIIEMASESALGAVSKAIAGAAKKKPAAKTTKAATAAKATKAKTTKAATKTTKAAAKSEAKESKAAAKTTKKSTAKRA